MVNSRARPHRPLPRLLTVTECLQRLPHFSLTTCTCFPGARSSCNTCVPRLCGWCGVCLSRVSRWLTKYRVPFDGNQLPSPHTPAGPEVPCGAGQQRVFVCGTIVRPGRVATATPSSLPRRAPRPPPTSCAHPTASFLVLLHVVFDSP